jgi:hypothetical protein
MPTLFHGNDRGSALFAALVAILIFSYIFLSFMPRLMNLKHLARNYKEEVLMEIQKTNKEAEDRYDLR